MAWRPFSVTLFDCDSTLSTVEGIDELATRPEHRQAIAELTDSAMAGEVPLEDVYGRRLDLLQPTRNDVVSVRNQYKANVVPHAKEVVAALADAANELWVISGGLLEPVREFATWLGIEPSHVQAVQAEFDPLEGDWWRSGPGAGKGDARYADYSRCHLTSSTGKADVIRANVTNPGRKLLIGDGSSDLAAACAVDLFVAFAGVVDRPAVTRAAPVVITCESLAPVLALVLGPQEVKDLIGGPHDTVARACWDALDEGAVHFNDEALANRFHSSF